MMNHLMSNSNSNDNGDLSQKQQKQQQQQQMITSKLNSAYSMLESKLQVYRVQSIQLKAKAPGLPKQVSYLKN